jgi:pyruvate formate lyase activating enzyme
VLDTAKKFKSNGIHVEVTNLIIPGINDERDNILTLCEWVSKNLGNDTPMHFSAYHPDYKMPSQDRTPLKTLDLAYNTAKEVGIYFPYVGNIRHDKGANTYCPECGELVIERSGYNFSQVNLKEDKKCSQCGHDFHGEIIGEVNKEESSRRFSFF